MKLFFRRFGEGSPMIILHGLFGLSDNWVTLGKRFAENHTVFLPDLRNHGKSPHSSLFSIEAMVEDLAEFTGEHGLSGPVILGHSLGGLVSMFYSLSYPQQVRKLVVADISQRRRIDYSGHLQLISAMQSVDFENVTSRSEVERQLAGKIFSQTLRQFLLKNVYWRDRDHLGWRLNLDVLADSFPLEIPETLHFQSYPGECLFIRGGNSDYILDEDLTDIRKLFPNAVLTTIKGAGHWIHSDAPEEFLKQVKGFIG